MKKKGIETQFILHYKIYTYNKDIHIYTHINIIYTPDCLYTSILNLNDIHAFKCSCSK